MKKAFVILRDDLNYDTYEGWDNTEVMEVHLNQDTARKRLMELVEEDLDEYDSDDKERIIICMEDDTIEFANSFEDWLDIDKNLLEMSALELKKLYESRYCAIRYSIEELELVE